MATANVQNNLPRPGILVPTLNKTKGSILIRTAEGKSFTVPTIRTLRILPKDGYNEIQAIDGGVWEKVITTPFAVEIKVMTE